MKNKIFVYPQHYFNSELLKSGINDENVEDIKDKAFISIVCTDNCNEGYMLEKHGEIYEHYFGKNHLNVFNIKFDDLEEDLIHKGRLYKTITKEQAEELINFMMNNENKDFYIHCHAGISRSGAVGLFIRDYFDWVDKTYFDTNIMKRIQPNAKVYNELKKAYEKKVGLAGYEEWSWKEEEINTEIIF